MNTRIQKLLIAAAAGVGLLAIGLFVGQEIAPRESASQASNPNNLPGVAINAADTGDSQTTPAYQGSPGSNLLEAYQQAYRNIAATALPVVVEVEVTKEVKQSQRSNPFRFFFGPNGPQDDDESQTQGGFGSGIIIDKKGDTYFVLTNNHVVDGGDTYTIHSYNRHDYKATLVGTDTKRDIAVVKFDSKDSYNIAHLGDSTKVRPGDIVFAIGSPYAIQNTITQGIISAVGRTDNDFQVTGSAGTGFTDYLQTDAAINQGNSGGALVNIYGEVIGVNTWIASRTGGNVGLAFAVPINNAKKAAFDLMNKGKVEYGWLGVAGLELAERDAKTLGVKPNDGAFVGSVFWDSPAFKSGIRPGDVITSFNGQKLTNSTDLVRAVSGSEPNKPFPVLIIRDGKQQSLNVTLGVRNDDQLSKMASWPGFVVTGVSPDFQKKLKGTIALDQVMIFGVDQGSSADEIGLRQGDVITSVNGRDVKNLKDFFSALNSAKNKDLQLKLINRTGREVTLSYQP